MNISLKPELEQFVTQKVSSGQYANASDLMNVALEAFLEEEEFSPSYESYLRREIQRGIDQLDAGQYSDFTAESIIAEKHRRAGIDKEP